MKILVSGANGFVGSMLCRKLVGAGHDVRGLVRKTSDLTLLEGVPIHKVTGSLEDPASLDAAARDVELVYHAAAAVSDWGSLEYFRQANVEGTRNLLDASCRCGARRFVFISSVAVHSFVNNSEMDETSPQNPTPYGYSQTKREAEALVLSYHQQGKIEAVIIRPGDIYGPGDRVLLMRLAPLLKTGLVPKLAGNKKMGAFTYIENLTDALLLAGTATKAAGQAYIITDGTKTTWDAFFREMTAALGYPQPRLNVGAGLARSLAVIFEGLYSILNIKSRPPITRYVVEHMCNDFCFNINKARQELGYQPSVGLPEAMRRTAQWYLHGFGS